MKYYLVITHDEEGRDYPDNYIAKTEHDALLRLEEIKKTHFNEYEELSDYLGYSIKELEVL